MNKTVLAFVAVAGIVVACAPISKTPAAPAASGAAQGATASGPGVNQPSHSIAEIHAGKDALAGAVVTVRGKVVRYSTGILGKNWAHVQDGTGSNGTNDLTVTTNDATKVGDTVLVSGKITLDRDFGAGYRYALIIEDATVTVVP